MFAIFANMLSTNFGTKTLIFSHIKDNAIQIWNIQITMQFSQEFFCINMRTPWSFAVQLRTSTLFTLISKRLQFIYQKAIPELIFYLYNSRNNDSHF